MRNTFVQNELRKIHRSAEVKQAGRMFGMVPTIVCELVCYLTKG